MKTLAADLHIHTALSPCGGEEMTPPAIVAAAVAKGLAMIAICDHNTAGNVRATQQAAAGRLAVLAGMEITTAEEVHVLGIFPDADRACAAAAEVLATLPARREADDGFGRQILMDAAGREIGVEKKMLFAASTFSLPNVMILIKRYAGLAVASHVDRPSFSVMSQLGVFPAEAGFDAVEVVADPSCLKGKGRREDEPYALPVIRSSDSHYLADIASRYTCFQMDQASFEELKMAFRRERGGGPSGSA